MSFKMTKQLWFHKNNNKTFTRNTTLNAKNISLDINVHWTFLRSTKISQNCIFQRSFAMFHFRAIYGAAFSKPMFHYFSNFVKTPKNQTPVVKRKMDIFKNQECPF